MSDFLPFALPDIGDDEISLVVEAMRSGWLTAGPKTKQFEEEFAHFLGGGADAVAVNSATAGLHLVLEAVGVGAGDAVITTPYTFTATAEVVRYLGADPIFVDINYDTLNIDANLIEGASSPNVKAIMPVHFGGLSCDMDRINRIAKDMNLHVIEDAAHALPATHKGQLIGSLDSTATVYSFYATKTITTGEGGMIVTRDKDIARRCRTMRLHGISKDVYDRYTSANNWRYEVVAPGFKYNMTDIAAAIGICQLKKAWAFQRKRAKMATLYHDAFADLPVVLPPVATNGDAHAWHLYVLRLKDEARVSRDRFIELMAQEGIGCSVHFVPLHLHPYWKNRYNLKPDDFPNALKAFEQAVSIPLYTKMTEGDQARVIDAVRKIFK